MEGAVRLRFNVGDGNGGGGGGRSGGGGDARVLEAGKDLADGARWHRVEVEWVGDVITLIVDGKLKLRIPYALYE